MSERIKPILGALVTSYVVFYVGITYFFGPAMASDAPAGPMMAGWLSLAVVSLLLVLFYDWVNQQVGNPVKSGLIVAISQILLVDVYYVMNGTRGVTAAAYSVILLLVGWSVVGVVYGKLSNGPAADG
jgi:hypothetical protein